MKKIIRCPECGCTTFEICNCRDCIEHKEISDEFVEICTNCGETKPEDNI